MVCYAIPLVAAIAHSISRKTITGWKNNVYQLWLSLLFAGGAIFGLVDHMWNGELFLISGNIVSDLLLGVAITVVIFVSWAIVVSLDKAHVAGNGRLRQPDREPGTRSVKVRIEVANEGYALKPDMFADVVLRRELGDALFVPESAVLRPGERRIVFLDLGDGGLAPREIETGARVEGGYAVLSGLAEGDRVVTSANFLIDSESSLKAALASMGAANPGPGPHAGHAPAAPSAAPTPAPKAKATPAPKAAFVCPMHPEVTADGPASCRICGMDLVPSAPPAPKPTGHEHH